MNSDIFELGAQGLSETQLLLLFAGIILIVGLITLGLAIACYVLQSIGLHTLAKRRGIKHPWLAWIPFGDYWIIGSISDDVRLWNKSVLSYRRIILTALMAGSMIFSLVQSWPAFQMIWALQDAEYMDPNELAVEMEYYLTWIESYETGFGGLLSMAASIASIVATVLYYMCLYDLFASCRPQQKAMFLVLGILINVTIPFFIFACRNHDDGMQNKENQLPAPTADWDPPQPEWEAEEPTEQ